MAEPVERVILCSVTLQCVKSWVGVASGSIPAGVGGRAEDLGSWLLMGRGSRLIPYRCRIVSSLITKEVRAWGTEGM